MTTEKKQAKEKYHLLTKEIHEQELKAEDLQIEQRRFSEQVEECTQQIKQEAEQISTLYEELAHFGDSSALSAMTDNQEIIQQVQRTVQEQGDELTTLYKTASKQIQETTETLYSERGMLEW